MSSSNCCFLTYIYVTQKGGQAVWYSHLFQNFPQFIVILTVKGFGIVNKTEIDVFLELSCFFCDWADVGNLISRSSAFSKTSLNILLKPGLKNFEHYFTSVWDECNCAVVYLHILCVCVCVWERERERVLDIILISHTHICKIIIMLILITDECNPIRSFHGEVSFLHSSL